MAKNVKKSSDRELFDTFFPGLVNDVVKEIENESFCRIPCDFKGASRKGVDTWIRSGEDHPSPRNNLSVVRSGYADTWIRSGEDHPSPRNNLSVV